MENQQIYQRPWGHYIILEQRPGFSKRQVTVFSGHRLSLHSHSEKEEIWIIESGQAQIELYDPLEDYSKMIRTSKNGPITINKKVKHRIGAYGGHDLVFIEIQNGGDENDIERYENDYE
jgi:mannose-6-phosphate isomerase-like protein (cupin superfamily)